MNSYLQSVAAQKLRSIVLFIPLIFMLPIAQEPAAQTKTSTPPPRQTALGPFYPANGLPPDENPRYFPDGTFNGKPGVYDFTERFDAWYLRGIEEPSLPDETKQRNVKVYRFLKLPPFFHPWCVRISILPDGTGQAIVKTTNGAGGFSPGRLTTVQTLDVPRPVVERFLHLLDRSAFWSMPTVPPLPPAPTRRQRAQARVMGGTPWLLEGAEPGRYHAVERVSPSQGPFATLCGFMLGEMGKADIIPHLLHPPSVPAEVAAVLPPGYKVRVLAQTTLAKAGEWLLVYEKDEAPNPDPHVAFMRSGRLLQVFSDLAEGCYTAGFKNLRLGRRRHVPTVAFRCAEDGSVSRFVLFAAKGDSYEVILQQEPRLGALDIYGDPRRLHVFSARTDLDRGESCVYCLHRYTIKEFAWRRGQFKQTAEQTPQPAGDPNWIVEHPFFDLDFP